MLSRLPISDYLSEDSDDFAFMITIDSLPVTSSDVASYTAHDPVLSKVYEFTLSGWPKHTDHDLQALRINVSCGEGEW